MRRLFLLFYSYRFFFTFLFLQIISWWLIISDNQFVNASFFNSSNQFIANVYKIKSGIKQYFILRQINRDLADENAFLRHLIENPDVESGFITDSITISEAELYRFIPAKVINKTVNRSNNFLTLNQGSNKNIKPGMGVIGANGAVGRVKSVSRNFTTVQSLLHSGMYVSSLLKRLSILCTTHWEMMDPARAKLLYVPRHINIEKGDTVVTSGYNSVFPENIPIGIVESVSARENDTFLNIDLKLSVDFYSLSFVYVVENMHLDEKDSIEKSVIE